MDWLRSRRHRQEIAEETTDSRPSLSGVVLFLVSIVAAVPSAHRAAASDPAIALRYESTRATMTA